MKRNFIDVYIKIINQSTQIPYPPRTLTAVIHLSMLIMSYFWCYDSSTHLVQRRVRATFD